MRVATYIVFALLFMLPFIVFPSGVSYFETPKIFVAQCLIQILFLIQLVSKDFGLRQFDRRLVILITGLFALSLVNFLLYPSDVAFFGNVFRLQGIYLFWHFLLLCLLSTRVMLPRLGKPFFLILLGAELILAYFFGPSAAQRFYGTLGEAHSLAAFALFIFPFALFANIKLEGPSRTITSFLAFFLSFVLILLSGSRSGMIGLFIECAFLLLTFKISIKRAAIAGVTLLSLSLFLPFLKPDSIHENRADVWITAGVAGMQKPITGWGIGNIEVAFKTTSPQMSNELRNQYVDSSHNFLLDWWVQGGIIGVGLILSLLYLSINHFSREHDKRNLMIILGLMTVMSFNPVSVTILIAFWWLISQGFLSPDTSLEI